MCHLALPSTLCYSCSSRALVPYRRERIMPKHKMTAKEFVSWFATHPTQVCTFETTINRPITILNVKPMPEEKAVELTLKTDVQQVSVIKVRETLEMAFVTSTSDHFAPIIVR